MARQTWPTIIRNHNTNTHEAYNDEEGLFEILSKKFKPQYNEIIKFLQFHNQIRQHNESKKRSDG